MKNERYEPQSKLWSRAASRKRGIDSVRNKTIRSGTVLAAAMALACLLSLLAPAAMAVPSGKAVLNVKQVFSTAVSSHPPSDTFSYQLSPVQGTAGENQTFPLKGTASKELAFAFDRAGEYAYELSHTTPSASGYTYDKNVYTLRFRVDGDLSVVAVIYNGANEAGTKAAGIAYEHSYNDLATDPALMADPSVCKTVAGDPPTAEEFTFELRAGNPFNPMPEASVGGHKRLFIQGSGTKEFGKWSYEKTGTYYYTIYEVNTGARGYTYDTAVYTITDTVTSENGKLVLSRVVTNQANKPVTSCSFINTYEKSLLTPEVPSTTTPSGTAPSTPGGKNPSAPNGPKTGDESEIGMYLVLLCAAGAVTAASACYLLISKRRGKKQGEADE